MNLLLVGEPNSRRTQYFLRAAADQRVDALFCNIHEFHPECYSPSVVKIDPPHFPNYELSSMNEFLCSYDNMMNLFSGDLRHTYLNEPKAIQLVLNKLQCKQELEKNMLPVTKMLAYHIKNQQELQELLYEKHCSSVFIKPNFSSGAAGVLAYKFNYKTNQQVLYTSCHQINETLVNTRNLQRLENPGMISSILNRILPMETIIERWYPKAVFKGCCFDLRVVMQFGKMDYMIARQSNGPITNLQLNNGALPISQLELPERVIGEVEEVCKKTMRVFPGLQYAGIDVLLSKEELKPYVIEVNGQGDLIYQDIFHENRIYKNQIHWCDQRRKNGTRKADIK